MLDLPPGGTTMRRPPGRMGLSSAGGPVIRNTHAVRAVCVCVCVCVFVFVCVHCVCVRVCVCEIGRARVCTTLSLYTRLCRSGVPVIRNTHAVRAVCVCVCVCVFVFVCVHCVCVHVCVC